jgi:L-2-hydroxyglutarate oxidase LhgO
MSDAVECVVIGAGVVGLAVARALAQAGHEVLILEAARQFGTETSSRNSEVIHAGLHYPNGSLKARFCVRGRDLLYEYCAGHGVPHRRLGKLTVACTEQEVTSLGAIVRKAEGNGVADLEWVSGEEARAMEPELRCLRAFHSPSTGIVDSHALMLAYLGDAEAAGAAIAYRAPVTGGRATRDGFALEVGGDAAMVLECKLLVNAAGLYAPSLSRKIAGIPPATIPRDYFCRGVYFTLSGRAPFRRLVYPVPEHAGLGVHLTLDMGGQAKFGPDTEWIDGVDYTVDARRGEKFYAAIRTYWPGLRDGTLQPGYAGIRPKISGPTDPAADFVVQAQADHGVAGLVNLYGVESPGLTSSLAIAEHVASLVQ